MHFFHFRQQRWDTLTTPNLKNQSPEAKGHDFSQGSSKVQVICISPQSDVVFIGTLRKPQQQWKPESDEIKELILSF